MPTSASDGDMIARSVHDPEAFVTLFERHFRAIHAYLARRIGDGVADDLAAEVFAQAFRVRARYRPETDDARPWLYGIAANLLFKHRRTEARRLRALARSRSGTDEIDVAGLHARADAAALAPRVAAALRAMEPRDREVLLLFAWADLSYAEIGSALAIPTGTVRSRLNRARAQLRRELSDEEEPALELPATPATEGARHA